MPSPEPRIAFGSLLREQLRITSFALRREALLASGALVLICIFSLGMAWRYDDRLYLQTELLLPTLFVAPLLPFALWKGDPVFGRAFLWTLPVRRQHAAIAKVAAGAIWLMAALAITIAALGAVALASGGGIGEHRDRLLETATGLARLHYESPAWMWLMPFAGALILYLIGSALVLGLRHPIRWVAGLGVVIGLLVAIFVNLAPLSAIAMAGEKLRIWLIVGPVGLDYVLSGGEDALSYWRPGEGREFVQIWRGFPTIGGWALATGFWLLAALMALALALRRHWER